MSVFSAFDRFGIGIQRIAPEWQHCMKTDVEHDSMCHARPLAFFCAACGYPVCEAHGTGRAVVVVGGSPAWVCDECAALPAEVREMMAMLRVRLQLWKLNGW